MNDAKQMQFSTAEYPQLEGLETGAPVEIDCKGTVDKAENGMVSINITDCNIQTENQVDKDYRRMTSNDTVQNTAPKAVTGDDF